jgi:hypothetical protein
MAGEGSTAAQWTLERSPVCKALCCGNLPSCDKRTANLHTNDLTQARFEVRKAIAQAKASA